MQQHEDNRGDTKLSLCRCALINAIKRGHKNEVDSLYGQTSGAACTMGG